MKRTHRYLPLLTLCLVALLSNPIAVADPLRVFAPASLGGVLGPIANQWADEHGEAISLSYAGSSALARQIQQGAPADIFISANILWMDALADSGDIRPQSRRPLLSNTLVLIGHGVDAPNTFIKSGFDLRGLLGDDMLAMALTDAVPAGIYGKQALVRLGVWSAVADRVAQTDNVRAALALVARGEAGLGIVYASDALAEPRVSVVGRFPIDSHDPVVYPAALTMQSRHPQAERFLDYLGGDTARAVFRRAGFEVAD